MKKLLFTMFFISSFLMIKAQNDVNQQNSLDTLKQQKGDRALEVNFDPGKIFGSNEGDQFSLFNGSIKYRKFNSDLSAFRTNINLIFLNTTDITQQEDKENDRLELKDKTNMFTLNVQPGWEKHFSANKRMSPYVGIQCLIGFSTSTVTNEYQYDTDIYIEKWINDNDYLPGLITVGIGTFAGIDYYFVKKLYLGLEIGYGLQYAKLLKTKYLDEKDDSYDYERNNGSVFGISPALATGNLRLGWTF